MFHFEYFCVVINKEGEILIRMSGGKMGKSKKQLAGLPESSDGIGGS